MEAAARLNSLETQRESALQQLEILTQEKERMEVDLLKKFLFVLNEKKKKIRVLKDQRLDILFSSLLDLLFSIFSIFLLFSFRSIQVLVFVSEDRLLT